MRAATPEIVKRHEVLRASFDSLFGHARQNIAPSLHLPLTLTDISSLAPEPRREELLRLVRLDASLPFDLSSPPLLRASLIRLSDDDCAALLTMHHIVSDGWSTNLFLRELSLLYDAFSHGRPSPLSPLSIQYADFALWQREWLSGERLDAQLRYWRERLAGAPAVLELPCDRPRPPLRSMRGGRRAIALSAAVSQALRALSARAGATLFMTLLTAFKILLWRHTGQADVVVGTPIAGRNRAEVEPLIGFFVNTLALRTRLHGEWTFREALEHVREACLGAYAHQDLPFEKLVEELQPERSLSHPPLFQVMFTLQQQGAGLEMELGELRLSPLEVEDETEKFDLTMFADETGPRMELILGYNRDIFEEESAERMLRHYGQLLQSIVSHPRRRIAELEMLGE
ncbi:MAG: condensation domain-containing protein, partial [Acidobacteria bacterium]|nr:condensation domain-containing protein [Acidobacteriota bacterium]